MIALITRQQPAVKRRALIHWLTLMLAISGLLFVGSALAQNTGHTGAVKIGFVNIRKIMAQAPQIQQIQQNLAKEFDGERQTIIALRNDIAELSNRYDESLNTLSEQAQAELQKSIDEKQLELSKQQQRMQGAYNLRRNEALAKLQTLIVNMVAKVSEEKQLDIVLNNTGVIYVNSRIDITADVLNYLSEQTID